ncbi:pseudouridine synthase [Leptospira sp. GIMC2001]|uniref:pseudouridine synthase n=1 Tax=Leptospira sp. GIMC2001 TaxID=1513297 RepID=UPI003FA59A7C
MRINRFLAGSGITSRRKAEEWIREGRVRVNGNLVVDLGTQINTESDLVTVDNVPFNEHKPVSIDKVIILNKPAGYLTSHSDRFHDKTIFDLLPQEYANFRFAGRLDLESRGVLILSDSGDVIQRLSHPSLGPEKEYIVHTFQKINAQKVDVDFRVGIRDQGETLRAKSVSPITGDTNSFRVVLEEGKKRQLRRMFLKLGGRVSDLYRVRVGNFSLEKINIAEGKWKWIDLNKIIDKAK